MSSNKIITKSNAAGVRAWRPDTLTQATSPKQLEADNPAEAAAKAKARVANELDQARARAKEEGHAEGYRAGIARAEGEIEAMRALFHSFELSRNTIEQKAAAQVLALSLDVAKQMLRKSLAVKPEALLDVINEAIKTFPELEQGARLVLHPDDAALVRNVLTRDPESPMRSWSVIEDAAMTRGGCRIQTSASDIDATVESRWRRLVAVLGADDTWIDPQA